MCPWVVLKPKLYIVSWNVQFHWKQNLSLWDNLAQYLYYIVISPRLFSGLLFTNYYELVCRYKRWIYIWICWCLLWVLMDFRNSSSAGFLSWSHSEIKKKPFPSLFTGCRNRRRPWSVPGRPFVRAAPNPSSTASSSWRTSSAFLWRDTRKSQMLSRRTSTRCLTTGVYKAIPWLRCCCLALVAPKN